MVALVDKSHEELKEIVLNRFRGVVDTSLPKDELIKILTNVYYLDKKTLEKIDTGEIVGVNGLKLPTFNSLMGLTVYRINKIKDNLRTVDEEDDLKNQAWIGYVYTAKRCLSYDVSPPIRSFQNYYGIWLETELIRYIKKSTLLIKTPYQDKVKIAIGDSDTNEVALSEAEYNNNLDGVDENILYLRNMANIALENLDEEERLYIELMFGLNGRNPHSMVDICKLMQISRNKASNMKQTALFKMKNFCGKKGINKEIALY